MPKPILVLGTANRKKGIELARLLEPAGLELRTLADFPGVASVEETGDTMQANAAMKAAGYARQLGHWVAADDSGLSVDALDGAPGVYSARYSGPDATDAANNQKLLAALDGVPLERRGARFVCHVALADPAGQIQSHVQAACRGRIVFTPRGQHGFGYDPLFEIVEYHRTFGELGAAVKSHLSHRARATERLLELLIDLVDRGRIAASP